MKTCFTTSVGCLMKEKGETKNALKPARDPSVEDIGRAGLAAQLFSNNYFDFLFAV